MATPEFWIIAGPNGAGKTTCVQREPIARLLPHVKFLNPDDLTLTKLKALGYVGFSDASLEVQSHLFIEAANEILHSLEAGLSAGKSMGVESVLSTNKYRRTVERVRQTGGFVGLIYICLSSPEIARKRIEARVKLGGHGVPMDKVAQRWHRSLDLLPWFASNASSFWIIDNSNSDMNQPPSLVATGNRGLINIVNQALLFPRLLDALSQVKPRK